MDAIRIGYLDAAHAVIAVDGIQGLFGRDLKTGILTNNLQGIMFSVLWKLFLDGLVRTRSFFLIFSGS